MPIAHASTKALSLASLGRFDDAIKCYDRALELNPDDADTYINKGTVLEKLGYDEEAKTCYNRATQLKFQDAGTSSE